MKKMKFTRIFALVMVIVTVTMMLPIQASAASYTTGTYKITARSGLNVRSGPGGSYSKVTAIPYNKTVSVTQISGSWGKVTYNNRTGWISMQYTSKVASASSSGTSVNYQVRITANSGLIVRSGAGTSYSRLTAIPKNTVVTVTKESNGWGYVSYNGRSGWISLAYTAKVTQSSSSQSSNSAYVSTSGGSYKNWKQSDSRWGGDYIGSKTISKIGCAATSVAMLIVKSGLRSEKNFDPGVFVEEMNDIGGFDNNDIYWGRVQNAVQGFNYEGAVTLKGSKADKISTIKYYADRGYYIVVAVKNYGHYVAVDSVSSSTVTMMDPGSYSTDLFAKYSASGVVKLRLYKTN